MCREWNNYNGSGALRLLDLKKGILFTTFSSFSISLSVFLTLQKLLIKPQLIHDADSKNDFAKMLESAYAFHLIFDLLFGAVISTQLYNIADNGSLIIILWVRHEWNVHMHVRIGTHPSGTISTAPKIFTELCHVQSNDIILDALNLVKLYVNKLHVCRANTLTKIWNSVCDSECR